MRPSAPAPPGPPPNPGPALPRLCRLGLTPMLGAAQAPAQAWLDSSGAKWAGSLTAHADLASPLPSTARGRRRPPPRPPQSRGPLPRGASLRPGVRPARPAGWPPWRSPTGETPARRGGGGGLRPAAQKCGGSARGRPTREASLPARLARAPVAVARQPARPLRAGGAGGAVRRRSRWPSRRGGASSRSWLSLRLPRFRRPEGRSEKPAGREGRRSVGRWVRAPKRDRVGKATEPSRDKPPPPRARCRRGPSSSRPSIAGLGKSRCSSPGPIQTLARRAGYRGLPTPRGAGPSMGLSGTTFQFSVAWAPSPPQQRG